MPLRAGLGLITETDLEEYTIFSGSKVKNELLQIYQQKCKSLTDFGYKPGMLCPKLYTTRTHKLDGEYFVVEGSRFKAKATDPIIEFTAVLVARLNLRKMAFDGVTEGAVVLDNVPDINFLAEDDLGYKGFTLQDLKTELLTLNPKATEDTPFYVHRLWGINPITDAQKYVRRTQEVAPRSQMKRSDKSDCMS